jgi:hypothetical protein
MIYSEEEDPNVTEYNKENGLKLKEGQEVTINIPFTYTIGEEGAVSGKVLETIEDCEDEVRAELDSGNINGCDAMLVVE